MIILRQLGSKDGITPDNLVGELNALWPQLFNLPKSADPLIADCAAPAVDISDCILE